MGDFSTKFSTRLELPKDHIISYEQNEFIFGLRKILHIKYIVNKRIKPKNLIFHCYIKMIVIYYRFI